MSDLRWSDCDEQVHRDPIGALLCRTSKLNDWAHATEQRLLTVEHHVNWFGLITTGLGVISTGIAVWRSVHGA